MPMTQMVLNLDEDDFLAICKELEDRKRRNLEIDPTGKTLLPEGESNVAGGLLAECCRDLIDYRDLFESQRSKPGLKCEWLELARRHQAERKEIPVIVGIELYSHFGQPCRIIEIQSYPAGMTVTLAGPFDDLITIDAESLELLGMQ